MITLQLQWSSLDAGEVPSVRSAAFTQVERDSEMGNNTPDVDDLGDFFGEMDNAVLGAAALGKWTLDQHSEAYYGWFEHRRDDIPLPPRLGVGRVVTAAPGHSIDESAIPLMPYFPTSQFVFEKLAIPLWAANSFSKNEGVESTKHRSS